MTHNSNDTVHKPLQTLSNDIRLTIMDAIDYNECSKYNKQFIEDEQVFGEPEEMYGTLGMESKASEGKWNDLTPDMKLQVAMHHNLGGGDSGVKFEDLSEEDKDEYVLKLIYAQTMGKSLWGVESKASEDLAKVGDTILDPNGRNFSLHNKFNFNSGDPFCKICGESVIDEQGVWEDHLINTHGYYIVPWSKSSEAGLDDHSCPECGFITSDNSDYVDHLNAHED